MGFDFRNDRKDYLGLTGHRWEQIYELAVANGWQPKGTLPNRAMLRLQWEQSDLTDEQVEAEVERVAAEWAGSYFYNEYQIVEADDAACLADALERAAANAAPAAAEQGGIADDWVTAAATASSSSEWDEPLPAASRELLQACIEFFRRGRFRVG